MVVASLPLPPLISASSAALKEVRKQTSGKARAEVVPPLSSSCLAAACGTGTAPRNMVVAAFEEAPSSDDVVVECCGEVVMA
jgi:hypothetical protein